MSRLALNGMSVDELFRLRSTIDEKIKAEILSQQKALAEKMSMLGAKPVFEFPDQRSARPDKRSMVRPKYRNPKDPSQTWAGRGNLPSWMQEALMNGAKREDFLIQPRRNGGR